MDLFLCKGIRLTQKFIWVFLCYLNETFGQLNTFFYLVLVSSVVSIHTDFHLQVVQYRIWQVVRENWLACWMRQLPLFSHSVVSNFLRPYGLQHTRLSCPSPSPGVCSNSYLLSWWGHPTISSSVIPVSSCLQSFPESGSFLMSQFLHQVAKVLEFQLQY